MQRWDALLDHHFDRFLRGETSFIGQRRARIRGLFGLTPSQMPDSEVDAIYAVYRESKEGPGGCFQMQSKPWTLWVCFRLGVISNGSSARQRQKLADGRHPGSLRGRGDLRGHWGRETPSGNLRGGLRSCGRVAVGLRARGRPAGRGRAWGPRRRADGRLARSERHGWSACGPPDHPAALRTAGASPQALTAGYQTPMVLSRSAARGRGWDSRPVTWIDVWTSGTNRISSRAFSASGTPPLR